MKQEIKWVKLKRYCELSGETTAAVHGKRKAGHFLDGIHTKIADDGNLWVNLEAIEKWVEEGRKSSVA
jgi:hypothetical protein